MALVGYARVSTEDQPTAWQLDKLRAAGCAEVFDGGPGPSRRLWCPPAPGQGAGGTRAMPPDPLCLGVAEFAHADHAVALEAVVPASARPVPASPPHTVLPVRSVAGTLQRRIGLFWLAHWQWVIGITVALVHESGRDFSMT
jgi:hypothetical protein